MSTVELACFAGFSVAIFSAHFLAAGPRFFDPQCTKYLSRGIYLTYWSNLTGVAYYGSHIAGVDRQLLLRLFPMMFAAGCFLTVVYYILDFPNAESRRKKERCRAQFPYIFWNDHLAHGHALPLVLLHAMTLQAPAGLQLPTIADATFFVGVFAGCYLVAVHVNHWLTGAWPYPIIDEITRAGGVLGRCGFFAALLAALIGLARLGVMVVQLH